MNLRRTFWLVSAVVAVAAPSARASTAAVVPADGKLHTYVLTIKGQPGELNRFEVGAPDATTRRVSDIVPITAGPGCRPRPPEYGLEHVVECTVSDRTAEEIDGGDQRDVIRGGGDPSVIRGGDGDDFIDGQGGADQISGGPGNDTLRVSRDGLAQLDGGPGADVLRGDPMRPLGDPKEFIANGPHGLSRAFYFCDTPTDSVPLIRFGDEVHGCTTVGPFVGQPVERDGHLHVKLACPDRAKNGRGRCDVRIVVAGRGTGTARARLVPGRVRTIRVRLTNRREIRRFAVRVSGTVRSTKGRSTLTSAWSFQ